MLGEPGVFLNSVGDVGLLPKVLDAAGRAAARPDEAQMRRLRDEQRLTTLFV